ncbi:MAG: hypothetical protein M5U34_06155 [Chloroflexi bacterium]|nr:hypothetical protein [Chloroflexota bacterium]
MFDRLKLNTLDDPDAYPASTFRLLHVSVLAAVIGALAGLVAFVLFKLIGLIWNLVFFQQASTQLTDLTYNPIGYWMLIVPAMGSFIVSLMAKYGTSKIKGHGIPEAMEAILENSSRINPGWLFINPLLQPSPLAQGAVWRRRADHSNRRRVGIHIGAGDTDNGR